jgi:hypothetical protein
MILLKEPYDPFHLVGLFWNPDFKKPCDSNKQDYIAEINCITSI